MRKRRHVVLIVVALALLMTAVPSALATTSAQEIRIDDGIIIQGTVIDQNGECVGYIQDTHITEGRIRDATIEGSRLTSGIVIDGIVIIDGIKGQVIDGQVIDGYIHEDGRITQVHITAAWIQITRATVAS